LGHEIYWEDPINVSPAFQLIMWDDVYQEKNTPTTILSKSPYLQIAHPLRALYQDNHLFENENIEMRQQLFDSCKNPWEVNIAKKTIIMNGLDYEVGFPYN